MIWLGNKKTKEIQYTQNKQKVMGTFLSLSRPQSSLSSSQPTDWFSAFFQYYLIEQSQLQGRRRVFKCGAAEEAIKCERHISLGGFGGPPPGNFFEF